MAFPTEWIYQKCVDAVSDIYGSGMVEKTRPWLEVSSTGNFAGVWGFIEAGCNVFIAVGTILAVIYFVINLSEKSISIEHNESFKLNVTTSTKGDITYKSNKTSVAVVDENGTVTGCKPGDAIISVKADSTTVQCKVKVKTPTVKLNPSSLSMYRGQSAKITAEVSSKINPVWKSNRTSVANVDENGYVTALKHGTALITATVDGIKKICEVTVKPPVIKLSKTSVTLKPV